MLNQQNYLRVSVCKSNVSKEKNTYYARVQSEGKISEEKLIEMVKAKAAYIDGAVVEAVLKTLTLTTVECVEKGFSVDFLGLGTLKLEGRGSLKVGEDRQRALDGEFKRRDESSGNAFLEKDLESASIAEAKNESEDGSEAEVINGKLEGSYEKELLEIAKKSVEFRLQFTPSKEVRKHIKNHVEASSVTLKVRQPVIKSVEKVYGGGSEKTPSIIKIKGEDLKLVGKKIGLYIKTKTSLFPIPKEAILENKPKTLMFITTVPLKDDEKYTVLLSTQYAMMGNRQTSIVRRCVKDFSFASIGKTA
ncbi:MAG: DUF4469 domain-containing protein [Treponema sp.]